MGSTLEQDRKDILKIHKDLWEANLGLDIPRMASFDETERHPLPSAGGL